jgi:hypothetical protein
MEVRKITFSLRVPKKINLSGFVVNTAQYKNKSRDYSYRQKKRVLRLTTWSDLIVYVVKKSKKFKFKLFFFYFFNVVWKTRTNFVMWWIIRRKWQVTSNVLIFKLAIRGKSDLWVIYDLLVKWSYKLQGKKFNLTSI